MKTTWMKDLKEDLKENWVGYTAYGFAVLVSWGLSAIGLGKINPKDWARF